MGLSPREVDDLTPWEFAAAADGYRQANGGDAKSNPPTPDEHDDMIARLG